MWQIFMLVPVINDIGPAAEGLLKGKTLLAQGMVRLDELYLDQKDTSREAVHECLRLCKETLKEKGYDTTVVGFGIRHRFAKKRSAFWWECTLQDVHMRLAKLRKAKRAS
jgi:hypothetical protein